jgi:hypothetical protein
VGEDREDAVLKEDSGAVGYPPGRAELGEDDGFDQAARGSDNRSGSEQVAVPWIRTRWATGS